MEIKSKKIEMVETSKIVPNPKNANKHTTEQIQRLVKLIEYQGFRNPLIVSNRTGFLAVGHGRLEAAKIIGMEKVPVIYQDFENEAQEYAYLISDNEIARWAELDKELVIEELQKIEIEDIELLGIDDFEIVDVEKLEPQTDEDEVPEVKNPITRRGDIWLLGNHRLMCGDSTMIDDVEKLMNGEKTSLILTDPPYQGKIKMGKGGFKDTPNLARGADKLNESIEFIYDFNPEGMYPIIEAVTSEKASVYLFCNKNLVPDYLNYSLDTNRKFDILTWHKPKYIPANNNTYYPDTEYLIKLKDSGATFNTGLGEKASYNKYWILDAKFEAKDINHPTVKPQEILKDCLLISSNKNEIVVDLFCGSGSTLICCETNNRKCRTIEMEEKFCDVTIQRWQNYTGKKATLESTGQTYEELLTERL